MKSVLHELYYGNINSNERPLIHSPECKQYLKIVAESEEKLLKLLEEKELFQTFSDIQDKLSSVSIADGFVKGICLGMRNGIEVILKQH
ncbi:MAG: DUF6809 family protein [Lacrimispora sphenoides]